MSEPKLAQKDRILITLLPDCHAIVDTNLPPLTECEAGLLVIELEKIRNFLVNDEYNNGG